MWCATSLLHIGTAPVWHLVIIFEDSFRFQKILLLTEMAAKYSVPVVLICNSDVENTHTINFDTLLKFIPSYSRIILPTKSHVHICQTTSQRVVKITASPTNLQKSGNLRGLLTTPQASNSETWYWQERWHKRLNAFTAILSQITRLMLIRTFSSRILPLPRSKNDNGSGWLEKDPTMT